MKTNEVRAAESASQMLAEWSRLTEAALDRAVSADDNSYAVLTRAMRHSLFAGGKRLRPALLLECYRMCAEGADPAPALPFACALEMIHTYSLIHDDLPCMDNADLRRGRPSCHAEFGESTALLAGDALLTQAFELACTSAENGADPATVLTCIRILAAAAGTHGMVAGQVIDLNTEHREIDETLLQTLHEKKTGALIRAAVAVGCRLGGADGARLARMEEFAHALGLQFQIIDDILDATATPEMMGKPTGSDAGRKTTYVTLYGVEGARRKAEELSRAAKASLRAAKAPQTLFDLVDLMQSRRG